MLVVGFLPARTLEDADFTDPDLMRRAANACRRLHAGPGFTGVFDMPARQSTYRETVRERGFAVPPTYDDHADTWAEVVDALSVHAPEPVPCNNDLLAANFLDDGKRVWLIDYEYSGMGDAAFELGNTATECEFTLEQLEAWVQAYAGERTTRALVARVRLQALAAQYGWSLWGFIQAATSPQDFDFHAWGMHRFAKAEATFRGPDLSRLLEEVTGG
jgi:thiamine kinase-like enzyme